MHFAKLGSGVLGSGVTSTVFYLSEGAVLVFFLLGLWWALGRFLPGVARSFPKVGENGLRAFCGFQVLFLACWSIVFKELLPDRGRTLLSTGGSVHYANLAAFVLCFLVPAGAVIAWRSAAKRLRARGVA
jgi:hypothetical protein